MKQLILFSLIILLYSCGSDPLSTDIIDSTWQLVSLEQSDCDDPDENIALTEVENSCITWQGDVICNYTIRFRSNGQGVIQYTDDSDAQMFDITYTVNDDIDEITYCEITNDCYIGTVDGDRLTLSLPDSRGCIDNVILSRM